MVNDCKNSVDILDTTSKNVVIVDNQNFTYATQNLGKIYYNKLIERLQACGVVIEKDEVHIFDTRLLEDNAFTQAVKRFGYKLHNVEPDEFGEKNLVDRAINTQLREIVGDAEVIYFGSGDGSHISDLDALVAEDKKVIILSTIGSIHGAYKNRPGYEILDLERLFNGEIQYRTDTLCQLMNIVLEGDVPTDKVAALFQDLGHLYQQYNLKLTIN